MDKTSSQMTMSMPSQSTMAGMGTSSTASAAMASSSSGMDMGGMGGADACKISVRILSTQGINLSVLANSQTQMLWNWYTVDACKSGSRAARAVEPC